MPSTRCSACGADVAAENRFCGNCGANIAASAVVTVPPDRGVPDNARGFRPQAEEVSREGRFPVGIVLGERYRILGLLGRGGMGEVYRAHDLKLEQQVALKFLPEAAAFNPNLMERFRSEVRIARQISHRNVCRVYDLGDINGAAFISMEYVDGEDLASLLRRIGRLPGDKALEFARRLCAGLAAAHEKGVLHRDLKPANIMIDGRGQLLIMDFGLAAVADAVTGHDIRSGTPAYMAPEQKEGRDVTVRSDVYALGLVLAEMFSGSRPTADGTLTSTSKDVDPAVEKVIQRCVEPNPAKRYASALDVARALPGGDPLAEALAAGDTPSPQMVAASDDTGTLSVRAAVVCLAFIVIALIGAVLVRSREGMLSAIPTPYSPEVLEQKARDVAVGFGYTDPPQDEAVGFTVDRDFRDYAATLPQFHSLLASGRPRWLGFWYRRSPAYLVPRGSNSVTPSDPPPLVPGMVRVELDTQARLFAFAAVPPREENASTGPFDWHELFTAAGLDQRRFQPADSLKVPPVAFDTRAAWTGTLDGTPAIPLRIEAASWKGRPVYFELVWPAWAGTIRYTRRPPVVVLIGSAIILATLLIAGALGWRHYRTGRADLPGAARLGAFAAVCSSLGSLLVAHHIADPPELGVLIDAISSGLFSWASTGVLYMALEPYVRRRWPQSLISWTRLLGGGIRDPLVNGQVLVGVACGLVSFLVVGTTMVLGDYRQSGGFTPITLLGASPALGIGLFTLVLAILGSLFAFFLVFLVRTILQRDWLAAAAIVVLVGTLVNAPGLLGRVGTIFMAAFGMWVLLRFGVLPLVAAALVHLILLRLPITLDPAVWYSGASLIALGSIVTLSVWSFRAALGGRTLLKADLLDA
jgi:serine/threonine-protein kinase